MTTETQPVATNASGVELDKVPGAFSERVLKLRLRREAASLERNRTHTLGRRPDCPVQKVLRGR